MNASSKFDEIAVSHTGGGGESAMASDRTGLLIISAWTERGSPEPLRAQVRLTTDVSAGFQRTVTPARAEEVCATVQEWLADFLSRVERPD